MIERVVIDVDGRRSIRAARCRRTSIARRSATTSSAAATWVGRAVERRTAARSRSSRRRATTSRRDLRVADAATGADPRRARREGRDVLRVGQRPRQLALPAGIERSDLVLAASDNWGHLYLHDLQHRQRRRTAITSGEGNVTQLLRVDEAGRHALLPGRRQGARARSVLPPLLPRSAWTASGRQLLTPEDADHDVDAVAVGAVTSSTPTRSPTRRRVACCATPTGKVVAAAREGRHHAAARRRVEAADADHGEGARRRRPISTACCIRPTNFDPSKKYPIINHIYPGPADRQRRRPQFSAARGDTQALAELGFIVVQIDGMGTPWRSKHVPRGVLRQHGRQHAARSGRGHEGAGVALSVDRHRSRRHLRPLGRRLRHRGGDVPLSRLLQGRRVAGRQSRQPRLRRRLGREVAGPAREEAGRHDQLRQPGQSAASRRS